MSKILLLGFSAFLLCACAGIKPQGAFSLTAHSTNPDYSQLENWAAHPEKSDPADRNPNGVTQASQMDDKVDVFFLHPTTYTGKKGQRNWNGDLKDGKLNERTDGSTILYQASIFNGAGRVFAPRYRQAHLHAYFTKDTSSSQAAFELAYSDVKAAFQYYLDHYNQGRPIIIASHSQGTTHGVRLLKEFFDKQPLQAQLVAAYLVGMPVLKSAFVAIPPCETPTDTNCFCSWRTYKKDYLPKKYAIGNEIAVTNPLSWSTDNIYQPKTENEGAVLRKFEKLLPQLVDAQVEQGVLWVTKPKFPGSFLFRTKNYHIADLNFFYMNVRHNAIQRAKTFIQQD
ncbi:MAG: DUF3089 domain-containing protein [Saprospiraceae bacterium]